MAYNWVEFRSLEEDNFRGEDPPQPDYYWVLERFYHGITIAQWHADSGFSVNGSDDIFVTHWCEIPRPDNPS